MYRDEATFRAYVTRLHEGWPVVLSPRVIVSAHPGPDGYRDGWTVWVDAVPVVTGTRWAAGALMQGMDYAAKDKRGELPRPCQSCAARPATTWGGRCDECADERKRRLGL